jgi:cbb3-type cytochrome oxidase subunit 3
MLLAIFALILFVICFFVGIINWVLAFRNRTKLENAISINPLNLKHKLSLVNPSNLSPKEMIAGVRSLIKMFLFFGSKESSREFLNNYYDVEEIAQSDDEEIKRLLNRSIRFMGNFAKCWMLMFASLLLIASTWNVS